MSEPNSFDRFSRTDEVRANLKQKSIRGALFMASGNAAEILVRFGSIAILARLLLPEDFGLLAMVMAITSVLHGLRDFGLSAATIQRLDISQQQVTNLFWVNVAVGAFLASIIASAAPLIASFYHDSRLVGISVALSLVFVWNGLAVQHEALLIRQLRQGELALIRLAASLISVIIAIALALNGWGYWSLVMREISRSAIIAIGVWLRCFWLPGLPSRDVGTRSLIRFGGEITLARLVAGTIYHLDKVLIGRFFGAAPVGMYNQAQQLVIAPIDQLNQPIVGVAQPALSALQQDPARYRRYYEKIVFMVGSLTVPLGLFITVCAEDITLLVLGQNWIEATVFVRIFGVGAAILPALETSAIVLITCGRSTRYLALAIAYAVTLVLLLVAAIPWGPVGVAIAYVGTTLIILYPRLHFSFVDTPASVLGFFNALFVPFLSTVAMVVGLLAIRNIVPTDGIVESLALSVSVGGVVYFAAMWLQPLGRRQLKSLFADMHAALRARQG